MTFVNNTNRRSQTLSLAIGFLAVATSAPAVGFCANPGNLDIFLPFYDNGTQYEQAITIPSIEYNPDDDPWGPAGAPADWRTTDKGARIQSATTEGLSFPISVPMGSGSNKSVTKAMSDAYWDIEYNVAGGDAYRLTDSNLHYNCYGYATGKYYWMGPDGFGAVMRDNGWVATYDYCTASGVVKLTTDHCLVMDECCAQYESFPKKIKRSTEKFAASGTYMLTYVCPFAVLPDGDYYRK